MKTRWMLLSAMALLLTLGLLLGLPACGGAEDPGGAGDVASEAATGEEATAGREASALNASCAYLCNSLGGPVYNQTLCLSESLCRQWGWYGTKGKYIWTCTHRIRVGSEFCVCKNGKVRTGRNC